MWVWENFGRKYIWQTNTKTLTWFYKCPWIVWCYIVMWCLEYLHNLHNYNMKLKFRFRWGFLSANSALQASTRSDTHLLWFEAAVHLSPLQLKTSLSFSALSLIFSCLFSFYALSVYLTSWHTQRALSKRQNFIKYRYRKRCTEAEEKGKEDEWGEYERRMKKGEETEWESEKRDMSSLW